MPTAEPGSWLPIGARRGGAIVAVLAVLIAGVGAGHLALSSMQVLLDGFAAGPGNEDLRDDGVQAFRDHGRFGRHAARGWQWRAVARAAARDHADLGAAIAGDVRRRGFASRRWCHDCVKAADTRTPRAYE